MSALHINGIYVSNNPRIMKLRLSDFILLGFKPHVEFRKQCPFLTELWVRKYKGERNGV